MRRALVLLSSLIALGGCARLAPAPALEFALLGDMPYTPREAAVLDSMIDDMNAAGLAFAVHLGDITSGLGPCTDGWLQERRAQFQRLRVPLVLLPGDNDWTDCHRTGFDPAERLAKWRTLFCAPLGQGALPLERQGALDPRHSEYCEHVRWQAGGALFVGLNVPGSNNNLGRTPAMDGEHARRTGAVLAWLEASLAEARARRLDTVVILMQANPGLDAGRRRPDGYAGLRAALAAHARGREQPLVLVHGDTHWYGDDRPLPNLRRIEFDGSPRMTWLRAVLHSGDALDVERVAPVARWPLKPVKY